MELLFSALVTIGRGIAEGVAWAVTESALAGEFRRGFRRRKNRAAG